MFVPSPCSIPWPSSSCRLADGTVVCSSFSHCTDSVAFYRGHSCRTKNSYGLIGSLGPHTAKDCMRVHNLIEATADNSDARHKIVWVPAWDFGRVRHGRFDIYTAAALRLCCCDCDCCWFCCCDFGYCCDCDWFCCCDCCDWFCCCDPDSLLFSGRSLPPSKVSDFSRTEGVIINVI